MKKNLKSIVFYLAIIIFVILLRIFIITPIIVDGDSMKPTLHNNDVMILNKIGYSLNGLNRFDIIAIKREEEHLIKRVIGLPGEKIEYKDNQLYVNNKMIKDEYANITDDYSTEYLIKDGIIPQDKYFVLGDNRLFSADSRIIGFIDKKDILGKTNFIIFPFNHFKIIK
ncbi:MAG: signal peptidase I [Mollicutes bacterium]|nr:signal peptidase I [Mollicutes bacterium]